MTRHLERHSFLMGGRPGASDFAIYGQLTQLTHFDPTPMDLSLKRAPRVYAWVDVVDDLSGLQPTEADWSARSTAPDTLTALFAELGRGYVPVMLDNERAVRAGTARVETTVDGADWVQDAFPTRLAAWTGCARNMPLWSRARVRPLIVC